MHFHISALTLLLLKHTAIVSCQSPLTSLSQALLFSAAAFVHPSNAVKQKSTSQLSHAKPPKRNALTSFSSLVHRGEPESESSTNAQPPSYLVSVAKEDDEKLDDDSWHRKGPVPALANIDLVHIRLKEILEKYPQYALWYIVHGVGKDDLYREITLSFSRSKNLRTLLSAIERHHGSSFLPDDALYEAVEGCFRGHYSELTTALVSLQVQRIFTYRGLLGSALDLAYERYGDDAPVTKQLRENGLRTAAEIQILSLRRTVQNTAIGSKGYIAQLTEHATFWNTARAFLGLSSQRMPEGGRYANEAPTPDELPLRIAHLAIPLTERTLTQQELNDLLIIFSAQKSLHRFIPWLLSMGADIHRLLERLVLPATNNSPWDYAIPEFFLPVVSIDETDNDHMDLPAYPQAHMPATSPLLSHYEFTTRPLLIELLYNIYGERLELPVAHLAPLLSLPRDDIEQWKQVLVRLQGRREWDTTSSYLSLTPLDWLYQNQQSDLRVWYRNHHHQSLLPQNMNKLDTFICDATLVMKNDHTYSWRDKEPSLFAAENAIECCASEAFRPRSAHPLWYRLINGFKARYDQSRAAGKHDPLELTGETWGKCSVDDRTQLLRPMLLDPDYYPQVPWMIAHGASVQDAVTLLFSHQSRARTAEHWNSRAELFLLLCKMCRFRDLQSNLAGGSKANPILHILIQAPGDDIHALEMLSQFKTSIPFDINVRDVRGHTPLDNLPISKNESKNNRSQWLKEMGGRTRAAIASDAPDYKLDRHGLPLLPGTTYSQELAYRFLTEWAEKVKYDPKKIKSLRAEKARKHLDGYLGQWAGTDQLRDHRNYRVWKEEESWHKWKMQFPKLKGLSELIGGRKPHELDAQDLRQLVIKAARQGYDRSIPILVYYGADLQGILSIILREPYYEPATVILLSKFGGDAISTIRPDDLSLAQLACLNPTNSTELLEMIITESPVGEPFDLNQLHNGMTLLDVALSTGKPSIIAYLMLRGAQPSKTVLKYLWKTTPFETEPSYRCNIGDQTSIWDHHPYLEAALMDLDKPPHWLSDSPNFSESFSLEDMPALFDPRKTHWGRKVLEIFTRDLNVEAVRCVLRWAHDDETAQEYANIVFECPNKDRHDSSLPNPRSETMATQILNSMYRLLPQEKQTRQALEKGLEAGADLLDAIFVSGAITSREPLEASDVWLGRTVVYDRADRLAEAVGRLGQYNLTNPNVPVLVSMTLDRLFPCVSFEQRPDDEWLELNVRDDLSSAPSLARYESAVRYFLTRALHAAVESGAHQSHLIEFLLEHGAESETRIMLLPDTIDVWPDYVYDEHVHFPMDIKSRLVFSPDQRGQYWHKARGSTLHDNSEVEGNNRKSLQFGYERSKIAIQISIKQGERKRLQRVIKAVSNGTSQEMILLSPVSEDLYERLPLIAAIQDGHTDIALQLIEFAAIQETLNDDRIYQNLPNWRGTMPLTAACISGDLAVVKKLLESGAELLPHLKYPPFFGAVESKDVDIVSALINHVNGNALQCGFTLDVLRTAIERGTSNIVELLLRTFFDHRGAKQRTAALNTEIIQYPSHTTLLAIALDRVTENEQHDEAITNVRRKFVKQLWDRMNPEYIGSWPLMCELFILASKAGEQDLVEGLYPSLVSEAYLDEAADFALLATLDKALTEAVDNKWADAHTVGWLLEHGASYKIRSTKDDDGMHYRFIKKRLLKQTFRRVKLDAELDAFFVSAQEKGEDKRRTLHERCAYPQKRLNEQAKQKQAALAQDKIPEQLRTYDEANAFASSSGVGKQEDDTSEGA